MTKIKPKLKLYTRVQCPLCDEAKKIILDLQKQFVFELEEIDIYSDDHLVETYGLMIPVIEMDGVKVQYGKIDKMKMVDYFLQQKQVFHLNKK